MAAVGDAGEKKMITLKSSDGEDFEVEEAVAMESQTIPGQNILEAVAMEPPPRALLPHQRRSPTGQAGSRDPSVRARPSGVIEYCNKHVQAKPADAGASSNTASAAAATPAAPAEDLKNWDAEFVKVNQATLFDLILVLSRAWIEIGCYCLG
ncbi:hypothetical protein ZWY2020_006789 [Hordeum vulgare]|nr:hypothetical protein ZWY2020_006789 [Hordeum vulgare]